MLGSYVCEGEEVLISADGRGFHWIGGGERHSAEEVPSRSFKEVDKRQVYGIRWVETAVSTV